MVGGALAGLADSKRPLPILTTWKLRSGGEGLLFRPTCSKRGGSNNRAPTFMRQHTLRRHLALALASCQPSRLSTLTWYQATRHNLREPLGLEWRVTEKLAKV